MDKELSRLDRALYRLLHHRSVRRALRAGQWEPLGLPETERALLAAVDLEQIEHAAGQVREDLLSRQHRGSGGLLTLYAHTIHAWRTAHPEDVDLVELMSMFMESVPYEAYQEVPPATTGLCLEEAFFRFCDAENIGEPGVRQDEFLTAMGKALVLSSHPNFRVPPELRPVRTGWLALGTCEPPKLYAAVGGRLVVGALTPFLAALLRAGASPTEVAKEHGVPTPVLEMALAYLSDLGLMD